jgi:hypothetical protein
MRPGLDRLAFLLLCLALALGLVELMRLRYLSGDLYPPYSSLRGDPLGVKVLHEALALQAGVTVERHRTPLETLSGEPGLTLFVLGIDPYFGLSRDLTTRLGDLGRAGARVVVSFAPLLERPLGWDDEPGDGDEEEDEDSSAAGPGFLSELTLHIVPLPRQDRAALPVAVRREEEAPDSLPRRLEWHSGLTFDGLSEPWRVLYARDGAPDERQGGRGSAVLAERRWGRGSIVVASDSFFLSNEALHTDRQPALLSWVAGRVRRVVFDETHLGIVARGGVMVLARRYRLQGLFLGLALLAGLYVWQAALPFAPLSSRPVHADAEATGREASAGLVALLRRGVPRARLLDTCVDAWRGGGAHSQDLVRRVERLAEGEPDPVAGYRLIQSALAAGGLHRSPPTAGERESSDE